MFPLRYELDFHISFKRNSVFKGLMSSMLYEVMLYEVLLQL
jgi:hypothetical protein